MKTFLRTKSSNDVREFCFKNSSKSDERIDINFVIDSTCLYFKISELNKERDK